MRATVLPALDSGFRLDIEILTRASMHRVYWDGANPLTARRTDPRGIQPGNRYDCPAGVADPFGVLSDRFCITLFDRAIGARGLRVHHQRSLHPATSAEAQAVMRRFTVVPT